MLDGPALVQALRSAGITHVIWVPDSELGQWDAALSADPDLQLIRVCREGEAFAIAAGLLIAGKHPVVFLQCTGLFEAGDALRNVVHDLGLPVFTLVGVRSQRAFWQGKTADTCPRFTEPIVAAWHIDYTWLDEDPEPDDITRNYIRARQEGRPHILLLPE